MKLNMVFFGNKGITATSARYVCDIAKDLIRVDEENLKNMSFVHREATVPGINKDCTLDLGYGEDDLMNIEPWLERCLRFKRLMAWLREAIKERDSYYEYIASKISEEKLLQAIGEKEVVKPRHEGEMTEGEYLASMSRDERARIYNLQTRAAVFGKAINENGYMTQARIALIKSMRHPGEIQDNGNNYYSKFSVFVTEPSVDIKQVDDVYFRIVEIQRQAQKELNSAMHKVIDNVRYENVRREEAYANAMADYRAAVKQQRAAIEAWRKKELHRVANLKIVIPDVLKPVYEEVQNLSAGKR